MTAGDRPRGDGPEATAAPGTVMPPPPGEPPRDVPGAPPDLAAPPLSQGGQWSLVWREFRKRRLALVATAFLLALVTATVFAPFLANDRPIAYRGANRYAYAEAARTVSVLIGSAAESAVAVPESLDAAAAAMEKVDPPPTELVAALRQAAREARGGRPRDIGHLARDAESLVKAADGRPAPTLTLARDLVRGAAENASRYLLAEQLVPVRIDGMASEVVPETEEALVALRDRFSEAASRGKLTRDLAGELRRELRRHPVDEVGFVGRWRFPVVSTLEPRGVGFLVADAALLAAIFAKLARRRPWRKRTRRLAAVSLTGLPLLAGLLWHQLVPAENDTTPYKQGVRAAAATENPNAPVLYESVVWPPVRFGLDEIDQDRKFARPELFGLADGERKTDWGGPHWLGTDKIGRDVLSRMLWGGRISLSVGLVAVGIYVAIGVVVGAVAGYFRSWIDMLISRVIEIVIVFPTFFLIVTIVAFVGPSLMNIMVVIGLTGWTGVARLVRGEFLRLADQEFILAGQSLGYSAPRLIFRHILPNAMAPVLVAATFGIAGAILTESALSFLGLGVMVPTPSWGGILAEGRATTTAPWLIYIPGLAIFLTILSYNLAGEALRDASDPRLRGSR